MDEDETFRRLMESAGVAPLDPAGGSSGPADERRTVEPRRRPPEPEAPVPPEPADEDVDTRLFEAAMRELDAVPVAAAPRRSRDARPPRRMRPRKKDLRVDERIDLHRCTGEEAAQRLERQVPAAARAGSRTLLVITGKGHHSPGGVPVLREKVEEWLRRNGRRHGIEAYSEAPRVLGGRGAVVVYLRRRG